MIRRNGLEGTRMSMQKRNRAIAGLMAFAALATASAAPADVKAGVDAWSKGDYAAAVHEWEGPAAAGDADAMFNLAQAYRLGRGVSQDVARAEELYAKAAAKGHIEAADTYGLMLFQDGRREAALPYIEAAAGRGDPRSEYLLGVATFNGDSVAKDWVKGYALVSLANAQGLPQATAALAASAVGLTICRSAVPTTTPAVVSCRRETPSWLGSNGRR
jgi:TPR repeat protein